MPLPLPDTLGRPETPHPCALRAAGGRCRSWSSVRAAVLLATVAALGAGPCGDAPPQVSREQFVDAYVGLVRARIDARGDSAAYAAKRERAFLDADVTAEDLRVFVESGREDPERLRAAWQAVAARLDTLYGGVTTPAPPALRRRAGVPPAADDKSLIGDTLAAGAPLPPPRR